MNSYDQETCQLLGIDALPQGDWVLPIVSGAHAGKYIAQYQHLGSSGTSSVFAVTESEGLAHLAECVESTRRHWQELVDCGDYYDSLQRNVLRINGSYYVVGTFGKSTSPMKGFGGHEFRWQWHGDDVTYDTNDLWGVGNIPDEWREQLPDNAVFL